MNITDVANKYEISIRTLRYYEELGLINSTRLKNNIRDFNESELKKIELILIFKSLNLKLVDIKKILYSNSNVHLKGILNKQSDQLDLKAAEIQNKRHLLRSLLKTFGSNDITKHSVKAFVDEQLYFSTQNERLMHMLISKQDIVLEIGELLIPACTTETETSLLSSIKELREAMSNKHGVTFDKIRIRDNIDELAPLEYQILQEGQLVIKKKIDSKKISVQIDHIITNLKALLL